MSLADVVRKAVATANKVTAPLQATVVQVVRTTNSKGGELSRSEVNWQALVEHRFRRFTRPDGTSRDARTKLTILQKAPLADGDVLRLTSGEEAVVLAVDYLEDPQTGGGYLTEVWLGSNEVGSKGA